MRAVSVTGFVDSFNRAACEQFKLAASNFQ